MLAGVCIGRRKFAVFELGNGLGDGRRRRAEHLYALHGKRAQDDAADAAAQDGVEVHVLLVAGLRLTQRHRVDTASFRVEECEECRVRQMRFDLRIEAFGEFDGDAELHGIFSRGFRSGRILTPAQYIAYARNDNQSNRI